MSALCVAHRRTLTVYIWYGRVWREGGSNILRPNKRGRFESTVLASKTTVRYGTVYGKNTYWARILLYCRTYVRCSRSKVHVPVHVQDILKH